MGNDTPYNSSLYYIGGQISTNVAGFSKVAGEEYTISYTIHTSGITYTFTIPGSENYWIIARTIKII